MARIRLNGVSSFGTTCALTFANGSTTAGTFSTATNIPALADGDELPITVDEDTTLAEIVYLLGPYTAGATSGTFERNAEPIPGGAGGVAHTAAPWVHGPTELDMRDATVNAGVLDQTGLLALAIPSQPLVPVSGIIPPLPPQSGFEFPGEFDQVDLGGEAAMVCAGRDGNIWATQFAGEIWRVTPDGAAATSFALTAAQANGVCSGPDGNLWVADQTGAVWRVTPAGTTTKFTLAGAPLFCAAGADGFLYFTDTNLVSSHAQIWKVDTSGVSTSIPITGNPDGTYGVCAGPDGNVWACVASHVSVIRPDGTTDTFATGVASGLNGICCGPDGNLYAVDNNRGSVWRVTPEGVLTELPVTGGASQLTGIAVGAGGDLWIADEDGAFWKLTIDGIATSFTCPTCSWVCTGPDGSLWLSGGGGLLVFPFVVTVPQLKLTHGPVTTGVLEQIGSSYSMLGTEAVIITDSAITLPDPSLSVGKRFIVKDSGSGTGSLVPFAAENIDAGTTIAFAAYQAVEVTARNNGNWAIIGSA